MTDSGGVPGVILAGGQSRRMGADKATTLLAARRLVDHVAERLGPQVSRLYISGPEDYGLGIEAIVDATDRFEGPVAGIFSAAAALRRRSPNVSGFVTAPVDGPFLPPDLVARLCAAGRSAAARDAAGLHPTFAYWTFDALDRAATILAGGVSLHRLAECVGAAAIDWPGDALFLNINGPEDLQDAERRLRGTE